MKERMCSFKPNEQSKGRTLSALVSSGCVIRPNTIEVLHAALPLMPKTVIYSRFQGIDIIFFIISRDFHEIEY